MSKRRHHSTTNRLRLFERHKGICHLCGTRIQAGQRWEISHPIPLELCGPDDVTNWAPAHFRCHKVQTANFDIPAIAKAKRREAKHLGAKEKRPWSPVWKRKISGQTVRRMP